MCGGKSGGNCRVLSCCLAKHLLEEEDEHQGQRVVRGAGDDLKGHKQCWGGPATQPSVSRPLMKPAQLVLGCRVRGPLLHENQLRGFRLPDAECSRESELPRMEYGLRCGADAHDKELTQVMDRKPGSFAIHRTWILHRDSGKASIQSPI